MIKINHVGEINTNTHGTKMKIVRYGSNEDIDIEFLDEFHYIKEHQAYSNFKSGGVKNPYDRDLYNVGYFGVGNYSSRDNGKMAFAYKTWTGMIERCYLNKKAFPAYYGKCEVCSEWHNYQNFAKWFEENKYEVNERLHIDKDILFPNSKMYSPKTCLLVPQTINMMFMNKPNKRGLPNGIYKSRKGYLAEYNENKLGVYPTVELAYEVYASEKEKSIRQLADEYINIIPEKVYNALYAYRFDINNDKNYKKSA